jgi:hypothetical protein
MPLQDIAREHEIVTSDKTHLAALARHSITTIYMIANPPFRSFQNLSSGPSQL